MNEYGGVPKLVRRVKDLIADIAKDKLLDTFIFTFHLNRINMHLHNIFIFIYLIRISGFDLNLSLITIS